MFGPLTNQPLPGRDAPLPGIPETNVVLGTSMHAWPADAEVLHVGMGCFWGVERMFWQVPGVITTAAGYMGGTTPNPTYREVCTGATGHAETVLLAYDPRKVEVDQLLKVFWENHDPTQGHRQGNDVGPQYRSAIYWTTEHQRDVAEATREAVQQQITAAGYGRITTEIIPATEAGTFYYAEPEHQQYLHKNPGGYCNHGPNGVVSCPVGILRQDEVPAQQSVDPPTA